MTATLRSDLENRIATVNCEHGTTDVGDIQRDEKQLNAVHSGRRISLDFAIAFRDLVGREA